MRAFTLSYDMNHISYRNDEYHDDDSTNALFLYEITKWLNANAFIKAWFIHISPLRHFSWLGYPLKLRIKDDQNSILTNFQNPPNRTSWWLKSHHFQHYLNQHLLRYKHIFHPPTSTIWVNSKIIPLKFTITN